MSKALFVFLTSVTLLSCQKPISDHGVAVREEFQTAKPTPPPPANANPVIAYTQSYLVSTSGSPGPNSIRAIYVMDENGANQTPVYYKYTKRGSTITSYDSPNFPAWSADGSKLCFTNNDKDLYTLNISLVSGVPTGSNATKIGDGVAGGGSYLQGKWRPGTNQIACVWRKTGEPDKIHLLPSTGGTAYVLYTLPYADGFIHDDIAFNPSGTLLLFSEKNKTTAQVYLKVIDVNSGQVINSIDMSQFNYIKGLDWAKTAGSTNVAIQAVALCDNSSEGVNQINKIYTLDVSSPEPLLTLQISDRGNICWSSNDTRLIISSGVSSICGGSGCCIRNYNGMMNYTLATQTWSFFSSNPNGLSGSINPDWKRPL